MKIHMFNNKQGSIEEGLLDPLVVESLLIDFNTGEERDSKIGEFSNLKKLELFGCHEELVFRDEITKLEQQN